MDNSVNSYDPTKRQQNPAYLVHHVKQMTTLAIQTQSSSLLMYACLDLRTTLEFTELNILLASVDESFRDEIKELSKTKNGIDRANKKIKTLKEKFQLFYLAICEIHGVTGRYFDFRKSDDLQFKLSQYLHTYTRDQSEIDFQTNFMQAAISLISETVKFIYESLETDSGKFKIQSIDIHKIPIEDKLVLDELKNSNMTYSELKTRLQENQDKRTL